MSLLSPALMFSVSRVPFLGCHRNGIIQYVAFSAGLLSFIIMLLRAIQVVAFISSWLLLTSEWRSIVWNRPQVSGEEHLDYFQFGAIMHTVAINIHIWMFVPT